jgi:hypothetical protein
MLNPLMAFAVYMLLHMTHVDDDGREPLSLYSQLPAGRYPGSWYLKAGVQLRFAKVARLRILSIAPI